MNNLIAYIRHPSTWFLLILIIGATSSVVFATVKTNEAKNLIRNLAKEGVVVSGTTVNDPQNFSSGKRFQIKEVQINGKNYYGNFFVYTTAKIEIKRSDRVTIRGKIKPANRNNTTGNISGYVVSNTNDSSSNYFLAIRDNISKRIKKNLTKKTASLGLAYLLGEKYLLDRETVEEFNKSGLSHIIVASGFALSISISLVANIFKNHSRFATLIFSILAMFLFANFTGFTPSITRAFLMAGINNTVRYFGRNISPTRIILIVASLSLIVDPSNIWNLGWQLSFTAFFGISVLAPLLTVYFYGDEKNNIISELLITTTAAQLCCLPILMYCFGSFTLSGLVSNIILPPLLGITMLSVFSVGLFSDSVFIEPIKIWTEILLNFHLKVVNFFSTQKWLNIELGSGNGQFLYGFVVILLLILFLKIKN